MPHAPLEREDRPGREGAPPRRAAARRRLRRAPATGGGRALNATIEIAPRFCGPPDSGNGGYLAGCLAAHVEAPAVRVRLHRPAPLERALAVACGDGSTVLRDGETKVAEAWAAELALDAPTAPSFEAAVEAARGFRGYEEHVFPGCFVCGPERAEGDGLRIFPGPHEGGPVFAAPWVPDPSLADEHGRVDDAIRWAALDCPGAFAFPQPHGRVCLLGEMTVALSGELRAGERCVLTSWEIGHEGRKHVTGSALHGEGGGCRGLALGTWIEIAPRG